MSEHVTDDQPVLVPPRRVTTAAALGLALASIAALMVMLAGLGSRLGWWHFRTGFTVLKWGAYLAIAALLISIVGAVMARSRGRRGVMLGLLGALVSIIVLAPPMLMLRKAKSVPPIHDITTDTQNPPAFVAVVPLRANALNPSAYGGDSIAVQQRKAYPDIQPILLEALPDSAFNLALAAAKDMGWQIDDASRRDGRIEATDQTFWFGFKDDVVIRVTPKSGISRVDVRSVSRVGGSDVGKNADRIRAYLAKLRPYEAKES
jgi:uncharacterized protein (DUF1499 family)